MGDKTLYKVEEYNRSIPLVFSEYKKGYVHSLFTNGFNILMGDSLVFFVGSRGIKLPFSMSLSLEAVHDIITRIKVRDPVVWSEEKETLRIGENCDVVYLEGKPYDSRLEKIIGSEASLVKNLEPLLLVMARNDEPTGLNLNITDFMEHYAENEGKTGNEYDVYYDLMDIIISEDEAKIERVLRYFLGRGTGGTPTGDDYIIGLMAIHTITEVGTPLFPKVLKMLIDNERVTTDVSIEYLKYALNNQFGSPIIELIHAMVEEKAVQEKVNNLIAMGHSSGLDTTFGIILGLLVLRRNMNG